MIVNAEFTQTRKLSAAQQEVLSFAPFVLTGPWPWYRGGFFDGIETVEQDIIRWRLKPNWRAPIRRLVKFGLLYRDPDGVYRKTSRGAGFKIKYTREA